MMRPEHMLVAVFLVSVASTLALTLRDPCEWRASRGFEEEYADSMALCLWDDKWRSSAAAAELCNRKLANYGPVRWECTQ